MKPSEKLQSLRERGCTCGLDDPRCPIHEAGDNRGLRAWFEAGLPLGFPMQDCTCMVCGTGGSMIYPDVKLDKGEGHAPTLICPRCSVPASEARLRREAVEFGYELKAVSVFGVHEVAA